MVGLNSKDMMKIVKHINAFISIMILSKKQRALAFSCKMINLLLGLKIYKLN